MLEEGVSDHRHERMTVKALPPPLPPPPTGKDEALGFVLATWPVGPPVAVGGIAILPVGGFSGELQRLPADADWIAVRSGLCRLGPPQ
jgi:hypothetical protein